MKPSRSSKEGVLIGGKLPGSEVCAGIGYID
jgi:hypothetical protein